MNPAIAIPLAGMAFLLEENYEHSIVPKAAGLRQLCSRR